MVRKDSCPAYNKKKEYSIPYLYFDYFLAKVYFFSCKFHPHGGVAIGNESIINEAV